MKKSFNINYLVTAFIAAVWIGNGLFCKVLNLAPRHQMIVAEILGNKYAGPLTKIIGVSEILMAAWILSGIKRRWCTAVQIVVVSLMNVIEFFAAPDLLLFGKWNVFFAFLFVLIVYWNGFVLSKKET